MPASRNHPTRKLRDVIAVRSRKNRQNDPAITSHDNGYSIPIFHSPVLSSDSATAYAVSEQGVTPGVSDIAQLTLARVQDVAGLISLPLQAAFNGLLTILQIIDRHAHNRAAIASLRMQLRRLSQYLCNAPSARDGSEQSRREELINLFQETSNQLTHLDNGGLGYQSIPLALAGFSTELDHYPVEYSFAALQIETVTQLRQFGGSAAMDLPIAVGLHHLTLIDGRGYGHQIPLEICTSFQRFNETIPELIFRDSQTDLIQARYVREGLYNLYIGVQVATRVYPDRWPIFKAGTKIVMKFLEPLCESFEDLSKFLTKTSKNPVGQGGFGDVWKCSLSYTSGITLNLKMVDVAVKVLRISLDDEDGTGMKDIRREIGIWKRLRHKHIVPFIGVADAFEPSRISLVSSWQENGTLTSLLKCNGGMECNLKDRLLLLHDIASGLSYLHSVNFVHGDLTGSNVLIDADGCARLTDFALSSVVDPGEGLSYLALSKMRQGAIRWMAPELCVEDIPPTFSSDIYSYGCIMLQTLSGCLPWSEIKNNHIARIVIKLSQGYLPHRPESLHILDVHWDFIVCCLNSSMTSRPSVTEVLEWIRAEIRDQGPRDDPS